LSWGDSPQPLVLGDIELEIDSPYSRFTLPVAVTTLRHTEKPMWNP